MKVLFQKNGNSGIYWHRQYVPHVAMAKSFENIRIEEADDISKVPVSQLNGYDLFVLHGRINPNIISIIKRLGKKWIYDVDDYWYCTPDRLFYNEWKNISHSYIIEGHIMDADAVTCTTQILSNYIKKHTGVNAFVLPNGISETDPQFVPVEKKSARLRFGFIGGSSHMIDMPIIGKAIARLWREFPQYHDKWQIVYGGFDMDYQKFDQHGNKLNTSLKEIPSVIMERSLTNDYMICEKESSDSLKKYTIEELHIDRQYRRIWTQPISNYATIYNDIDIALAPLVNNTFNRCKSNLKIIEAGWIGKEIIASKIDCFNDGQTNNCIMEPSNTDEWLEALLSHIETFIEKGIPEKSDLQNCVRENYSAEKISAKRYELYKTLMS